MIAATPRSASSPHAAATAPKSRCRVRSGSIRSSRASNSAATSAAVPTYRSLIADAGVQELELDPEALAKSRPDFADLRLLRDGNQIPYVLEKPALARSLDLEPEASADPKRPTVSAWRVRLPKAGLPLRSVVLASPTSLFQR